ncbi:MAG: tetratricopeptide repeat protein [Anaerolineales bacterium]|jgi:hypothetical protein
MRSRLIWLGRFALGALATGLVMVLIYQIPWVKQRLEWRLDAAVGNVRGWLHPGDTLPVPTGVSVTIVPPTWAPTATPTATPEAISSPTPAPTATPLPSEVILPTPRWEKQDWNNCGPATLSLGLRYYGWNGDQYDISSLLKPDLGDKNVNVEEMVYYVRTQAGWLDATFRVGGTIGRLKTFLAAGFPVIVEKGYILGDDEPGRGWAAHYLLLTGYDDGEGVFITQDSFRGADRRVAYAELEEGWKAFNRVYLLIYPPDQEEMVTALLGTDADIGHNRQSALERTQAEIEADPEDVLAWFNLGTNLLHFERYQEAAQAYDTALALGLPWRFTRYQFGPYIAYINTGRSQDVIDLADATLYRTSKAEESLLWRGWARYQLGDLAGAEEDFRAALRVNPYYLDAHYALSFLGVE